MPSLNRHQPIDKKQGLRNYYQQRKEQQQFYQTSIWRKARLIILARDILCKICNKDVATECDHINARCNTSPDEWFDAKNLQGLCKSCHSKKTRSEWK